MPIKTSESKFELKPYGLGQMFIIFSTLTFLCVTSIILGILFNQYQGSWILYLFAGIIFLYACVLFGIRFRKIRTGTLVKVIIDIEGIRTHSKKASTIKFMSWEDISNYTISNEVIADDEASVDCPSAILIICKDDSTEIRIKEYASILNKADKIVKEFEQAFKNFRKKYHKLNK
ncbi:MAG: hypothetical protein E3J70_10480 [Candidatus Heimdallarchaeota archaeon]|nr:MAG: hypothetical protein E3J70_10480 [Candidatus Heimdallarchaeota archaeon]